MVLAYCVRTAVRLSAGLAIAVTAGSAAVADPAPWGWWSTLRQPPAATTNPSLPLAPPSVTSSEYRRNYGLGAVRANVGFGLGATGKDVTVAVIDDGWDLNGADLQGVFSPDSIDIVGGRTETGNSARHGMRVAGIIASRFNGLGTIGIAYQSTILAIRADSGADPSCTEKCGTFANRDTARAIDYAVSRRAPVINMSFGSEERSGTVSQQAIQRAIAAGSVFTISAGNEGLAQSAYPARFANESAAYRGGIIAVGATGPDGAMASFSNRAGDAAQYYLTAPGSDVVTDCGSTNSCWRVGGTSFAAPHVAGALALLLQYFPSLSARDAVAILLRTADDKGDPGTDVVYGRGAMNLTRAFEPVGAQALATPDGAIALPARALGSALGDAFGDALQRTRRLTTFIRDDYNRPFAVDLADGYRRRLRTSVIVQSQTPVLETAQAMTAPLGANLTLAASAPMFPDLEADLTPARAFLRPETPSSATASVRLGALDFTAWRGHGQAAAPAGLGGRTAFSSLAASDRAVSAVWRAGAFRFGGEGGWSERRTPLSITPVDASSYAAATAAYSGRGFMLSVSAGALDEPRGALGSEFDPASPMSLAARTRFAAFGLDRALGPLMLRAEASVGRTGGGGQLVDVERAMTSSWRLALTGACAPRLPCRGFGVELAQPLRVEGGTFRAVLADTPLAHDEPITFSERRFSASPSRRELDLRLHADRALGLGVLRFEAGAAFNPAHEAGETDLGVSAAWRTRF